MFKKILFPTDNSKYAKKAMNYVNEIALKYEAEVVILHTYFIPFKFSGKLSDHHIYLEKIEQHLKENGESILKDVKEKMESKGIKVKTLLVKGILGPTIVFLSESENCDLVVMGSRGHGIGNVTSLLISSSSNFTIHNNKCPVLLVN